MNNLVLDLDLLINSKIYLIQNYLLSKFMFFITLIGNTETILILSIIVLAYLAIRRNYNKANFFLVSIISGFIINFLLKFVFQRARPDNALIEAYGYSFPSGHAVMSTIFFLSLIYILKDKINSKFQKHFFILANVLLFLLIGFSRIYFNVHWASDVIAGFLIGIFWIFLTRKLFKIS